jgi:hypothetical protein
VKWFEQKEKEKESWSLSGPYALKATQDVLELGAI